MGYDHPELVRKLRWYDRYAIFAFKHDTRGGLVLGPSLLVLTPALLVNQRADRSEASMLLLWVSIVLAVALALFLFVRGILIYRIELQHEQHVRSFWRRKWREGGRRMWLLMGLQLAIVVTFLCVAVYFAIWN